MRQTRIWTALGLLAAIGLTVAGSAPASADWNRTPIVYVAPTQVTVCQGTLNVAYWLEALHGHRWSLMLDDGREYLQLHEVSGRSGPNGQWMTVASTSGGEGHLRWTGYGEALGNGSHFDLVRIVRSDVTKTVSSGRLIQDECVLD